MNSKQQTLIPFFPPAFKRTISVLSLVAEWVEDYKFLTNWMNVEFQGWKLPSTLDPHYWCGLWNVEACKNIDEHQRLGKGRRVYVKQYQRSCYRASCIVCYLKWIAREANNTKERIEHYSNMTGDEPIHLILSVNPNQYGTSVKILRQRMSHILRIAEFEGGAAIFHPFAFDKKTRQWYPKPHFHLVGFGSEQKIKQSFGKYGWYVKNKGKRNSVFQTVCYLLSHCGIKKHHQAVTWYGKLSYSNMPRAKPEKITKCPVCDCKFEKIIQYSVYPVIPPDKTYFGLVDLEVWEQCQL